MHAAALGGADLADDRSVGSESDAADSGYKVTEHGEIALFDIAVHLVQVSRCDYQGRKVGVARAFADSIHGNVDAAGARAQCGNRVRHRKAVIVVTVEVERHVEVLAHGAHVGFGFLRGKNAEGVAEHDALDGQFGEAAGQRHYIRLGITHALRPVFQVDIDGQAFAACVRNRALDIGEMGFDGLAKLHHAMVFGSLGEQVQNPSSVLHNPVHRPSSVNKAQNLDFVGSVMGACPFSYVSNCQRLSLGNSRGADFYGIDT